MMTRDASRAGALNLNLLNIIYCNTAPGVDDDDERRYLLAEYHVVAQQG